jgi:dienelactone hydrolase
MLAVLLGAALMAPAADFPPPDRLPEHAEYPDPLTTFAGEKVTTKQQWESNRRPELKELFQHYMYGRRPADPANVEGVVLHEDKHAFGGVATLREIEVRFHAFGKSNPLPIRLLLTIPNDRKGKIPVFVGTNFCGNHALTDDPKVRVPDDWMYPNYPGVKANKASDAGRGKQADVWPLEAIARRGYAVATFYNGDIQPDRPDVLEGFRAVVPRPAWHTGDETATIMAWAWGVSRAIDYLVTHPDIDAKRIAVVGHSRLGKTALVAAAFDERIALAIPHQAGCGGTAPSRQNDPKAESVKRINTSFPHWFDGHFKAFNDATGKLPFDQHCLLALCAPRPVLYTNAVEDQWANPSGQFKMMQLVTPVYKLLGVHGMEAASMPEPGKLVDSRLGYTIRPGKHSMTTPDWDVFMAFADKWMK